MLRRSLLPRLNHPIRKLNKNKFHLVDSISVIDLFMNFKFIRKNHIAKALVIASIASLSACSILTACGGPSANPTTTLPLSSSVPATSSGSLSFPSGKYVNSTTYSGVFTLAYTVNGANISIGLKAKTVGWIAIALGNPHGNSDVMIGYVSNGQVTLLDSYNASESGNHPIDPNNDLLNISGSETGGITTIEFTRALNTGDKLDLPLVEGDNVVTWAFGASDDVTQEHSDVGIATITVNSGD